IVEHAAPAVIAAVQAATPGWSWCPRHSGSPQVVNHFKPPPDDERSPPPASFAPTPRASPPQPKKSSAMSAPDLLIQTSSGRGSHVGGANEMAARRAQKIFFAER